MKYLIQAILSAGTASAVQMQAEFLRAPVQTFYQSQDQCDLLVPANPILHYEFNQAACGCWLEYDISIVNFVPICLEPTPIFNPYSSPFNWKEFCIRQDEYDAFFTHGLGPDCLENTGDEVSFSSALLNEVQRA